MPDNPKCHSSAWHRRVHCRTFGFINIKIHMHISIDADYINNTRGQCCVTYHASKVMRDGEMHTVKFWVTSAGDVLRHLYIMQTDVFLDKARVSLTLECGPLTLVSNLPWELWAADPRVQHEDKPHEMSNVLPLLDFQNQPISLPMITVSQDCLLLTIKAPKDVPLHTWQVAAVWDFMSTSWRSAMACAKININIGFPVSHTLMCRNGVLERVNIGRTNVNWRRHSNPLH